MNQNNLELIDQLFAAYAKRDFNELSQILAENIKWTFRGNNPVSGVKSGINEVISFFDEMGKIMSGSNVKAEKLVMGSNDEYVIECQHIWTNRNDGNNLDHHVCVLWQFKDNKITAGEHFFADPVASDDFFNSVQ